MNSSVTLRNVADDDLPLLFEYESDIESCRMVGFTPKTWEAFLAHWTKILSDDTGIVRTVLFEGQPVGSILSFVDGGQREVGYWIGKAYWGRGIATEALSRLLEIDPIRPLYAHAAKHNIASRRVLEKCGFVVVGEESGFLFMDGKPVEEFVMKLDAR